MAGNLEQHLGELTGQLKGLVPALERLEDRQRESDGAVVRLETQLSGLRKEFDEQRNKTASRLADLFNRYGTATNDYNGKMLSWANERAKIEKELDAVRIEVAALKSKSEGLAKKAWDIVQLVLSAVVGGLATWLLSKGA